MKLLSRIASTFVLTTAVVASAASAQTPLAADLFIAADNGNGTSNVYTYTGAGNIPGTWTATLFGNTVPGVVSRIAQGSGNGGIYTLSQNGGTSQVHRLLSPFIGGYGTQFVENDPLPLVAQTTQFLVTDIAIDRSAAGNPNGGESLVIVGPENGGISLRRLNLTGGGAPRVNSLATLANASASVAIDPNTGLIYVATDLSLLGVYNSNFTLNGAASTPLNPPIVVNGVSWNDRGLGGAEFLSVTGQDVFSGNNVVRRYAPSGVSASAPLYSGTATLRDLATDANGHLYLLSQNGATRSLDHFRASNNAATALPALPGAPTNLGSSALCIAFASRAARGNVNVGPLQNLTQGITSPLTIGPSSLEIAFGTFAGGQPAPALGDLAVMHFSPANIVPGVQIPGIGNLLVDIASPGYYSLSSPITAAGTVSLPVTLTPLENGLTYWCQVQMVTAGNVTYLTDTASTFTVGYRPVE